MAVLRPYFFLSSLKHGERNGEADDERDRNESALSVRFRRHQVREKRTERADRKRGCHDSRPQSCKEIDE